MNRSQILLSVSIPTFNRAASLERTLGMIVSQLANHQAVVEVVISDNCSSDNTEEIATQYAAKHHYIKYYKNAANMGVDRNFDAAVTRSSGEFVWILADDDYIEGHAIREIIDVILSNPTISVIFVNYALYKDNFGTFVSNSRANVASNCVADGNDFYCKTSFANSFISSNVFRRTSWLNAKPEQYFDTGWIHAYVAGDILTTSHSYIICARLVRQGWDSSRLSKRSPDEYAAHADVFFEFLRFVHQLPDKGYDRSVLLLGKRVLKGEELRQIVFLKIALRGYSLGYLCTISARLFTYYKTYFSFWLIDLPILFLPNSFVRSIYEFTKPLYVKYNIGDA